MAFVDPVGPEAQGIKDVSGILREPQEARPKPEVIAVNEEQQTEQQTETEIKEETEDEKMKAEEREEVPDRTSNMPVAPARAPKGLVVDATPEPGRAHRNAEKLAEISDDTYSLLLPMGHDTAPRPELDNRIPTTPSGRQKGRRE